MLSLYDLQWVLPLRSPGLTQFALELSWLRHSTAALFLTAPAPWASFKGAVSGLFVTIFMPWLLCKARLGLPSPTIARSA